MLPLTLLRSGLALLFASLKRLFARLNNYFLYYHCLAVSCLHMGRLFYVRLFIYNFFRDFLFSLRTIVLCFHLVRGSLLGDLMALGFLMV